MTQAPCTAYMRLWNRAVNPVKTHFFKIIGPMLTVKKREKSFS